MTEYFIIDEHTNFYLEAGLMIVEKELKEFIEFLPENKRSEFTELINKIHGALDIHSDRLDFLDEHDRKQKELFYIQMNHLIERYGAEELANRVAQQVLKGKERREYRAEFDLELNEGMIKSKAESALDDLFGER